MSKAKFQKFENPFMIMPDAKYAAFRKRSSLIIWERWRTVKNVFGVVFIKQIKKGKDFDIVMGDIGFGSGEPFLRKFICKTANARKQIYTLTVNQYAIVYALAPKSNKAYYVRGWWATYVPKVYDRMEIEENESDKFTGTVTKEDESDSDILDTINELKERGYKV